MARRWIQSAEVEVDEATGALLTQTAPSSSFPGGTKTVTSAATPEKLVAASMPCRVVWLGARVSAAGAALNTKPVFIGDAASQTLTIMPGDFQGVVIAVDDASKLYVKVGTNGEGVQYRILA